MKKIKYIKRSAIVCIIVAFLIINTYEAIKIESYNYDLSKSNSSIILAGDENYPPYEYLDDDGEYKGFNVDLMRALSIELGIDIKLVPMDWMKAHRALYDGSIDGIQGMNFNETREKIYDFSNEYLINSLSCFVKSDANMIFEMDDLKGKRVAVQRSDSASYVLAEIGEIEIVFFSDMQTAFEQLLEDDIDAVLGNKMVGLYIIQNERLNKDIKISGFDVNPMPYGIATKKGNEELISQLNGGLDNLKKSGNYQKIYEKWFGKEIQLSSEKVQNILMISYILSAIAIIIGLVVYRFNVILKKEVSRRTRDLEELNKKLISQQKTIESNNRFKKKVLDSLGSGVLVFDSKGRISEVNAKAEDLLALDKESLINENIFESKASVYFNLDDIRKSIDKNMGFSNIEKSHIQNNERVYFSYSLSPLYEGPIEEKAFVYTFRDITEVVNLKINLAEKDKSESLRRLISSITHEIRNPLTSIKAYVELLPLKFEDSKYRHKMVSQVPREINRLNSFLTNLIDYSKPRIANRENFSLRKLVNDTMDFFNQMLSENKVSHFTNISNSLDVVADSQQIRQVLINIIINSIDAMKDGGSIEIEEVKSEKLCGLIIRDNGKGIDKISLERLFDPFYSTKKNGTGLGLAISYNIIKENRGFIEIESEEGLGTSVKILLPSYLKGGDINV